jgi:uncharacterized protein (TIGR00369 family)
VAPHSLKSAIQKSIAKHKKRKDRAHFQKLERMYLGGPCNAICKPAVTVSLAEAEVALQIRKTSLNAAGVAHGALYYKAMEDAGALAINSLVKDALVVTVSFNTIITHPVDRGTLSAKARYLTDGEELYLAEAVLTDAEGREVGRGRGSYMKSATPLSAKVGYR